VSRTYVPQALRRKVAAQAKHRCGYCQTTEKNVGIDMEIEHLIPESLGGLTEEDNLWLACGPCNSHKGARIAAFDPASGDIVRLFDPRRQAWSENFAWTTEKDRIVGLTPEGRATVVALQLNRPALVRARQRWVSAGWHPPAD
jgi:hypothetical protein